MSRADVVRTSLCVGASIGLACGSAVASSALAPLLLGLAAALPIACGLRPRAQPTEVAPPLRMTAPTPLLVVPIRPPPRVPVPMWIDLPRPHAPPRTDVAR